ncbi:unnamed protein product [Laminaria digitata]
MMVRQMKGGGLTGREVYTQPFVGDHSRPKIDHAPPRVINGAEEGSAREKNAAGTTDEKHPSPVGGGGDESAEWVWVNAGGEFGLSADWKVAVTVSDEYDELLDSIRGQACNTEEKRAETQRVLDRRKATPADGKVASCVRTKDFGRFLPEWIAYHYATGVDEIQVYDDDSVDATEDILKPFIEAGIVTYRREKLETRGHQMKPLNDCLTHYRDRRESDPSAPSWLLFHDTDEYLFPANTSQAIPEALQAHNNTCCLFAKRVQYGSAGYRLTPRGLTLENFLMHAPEKAATENRLPKVVLNLNPSDPEVEAIKGRLPSMHGVNKEDCKCDKAPITELRINHYLGSTGDFVDKTRRYWQENHSVEKVEKYLEDRDVNIVTSDAITHWACATREILARVIGNLDLDTGRPLQQVKNVVSVFTHGTDRLSHMRPDHDLDRLDPHLPF